VKLLSVTTFLLGGGDEVVCRAGEEDKERGGLSLEDEWEEDAAEELDRGERSSGLADGV
jgi:hypothetical protein